MTTIIQADREAGLDAMAIPGLGVWDDDTLSRLQEAFAAHREASIAPLVEVCRKVAGVDFLADESLFQDDDIGMIYVGTVRAARAALQSLGEIGK